MARITRTSEIIRENQTRDKPHCPHTCLHLLVPDVSGARVNSLCANNTSDSVCHPRCRAGVFLTLNSSSVDLAFGNGRTIVCGPALVIDDWAFDSVRLREISQLCSAFRSLFDTRPAVYDNRADSRSP